MLPLQSVDPNDHALGFGIADAVIRRISQTGEITVRPASSVRHYLEQDTDAITAAKQLSVDTVLEGTVQRVGGHVRIGVSLLRADGTLLWTESFDTQTTDVFAAQDTIAQQLASQLQLRLTAAQQTRLAKRSTSNPLAYDYYTRAVFNYDQRNRGPPPGLRMRRLSSCSSVPSRPIRTTHWRTPGWLTRMHSRACSTFPRNRKNGSLLQTTR